MAQVYDKVESNLGSLNAVSDFIEVFGRFDLSISGTWVGTVTFQRSFDDGSTWHDVKSYTANVEDVGEVGSKAVVRCQMTSYTSGTATIGIYFGGV